MAVFEDTFTEASDTLLTLHSPNVGTAWTLDSGDSSNLVVRALNNALVSTSVSRTFVRSDDLGNADCYVEAELSTLSGQNGRYVALRVQDSTNFIGWILAGTGGAGMRLVKVVSGNTTNLFTMQGVAGRVYKIKAEGTTIKFYEDGAQQGSDITESAFQTETKQGVIAFNTDSTTDFISTYNADVLGGGGPSGSASFDIDPIEFSSAGSATLPQPIGDVAFNILPIEFSVNGGASLPFPEGSISFDIAAIEFAGAGSVTTPFPVGSISFDIQSVEFSGTGNATQPEPSGDISFDIEAIEFSGIGSATGALLPPGEVIVLQTESNVIILNTPTNLIKLY